jgi:tetratricopeptide (TPR) repeat protein
MEQSVALLKHALELALEHDLTGAALRAYNNLGYMLDQRDRYEEAIDLHRRGLILARKAGNRINEGRLLGELSYGLFRTGHWNEAVDLAAEVPESHFGLAFAVPATLIEIQVARGQRAEARRVLGLISGLGDSADLQDRTTHTAMSAVVAAAEGRYEEALDASKLLLADSDLRGAAFTVDKELSVNVGIESAFALGRLDDVEELLAWIDSIPPGRRPPSLGAHAARFRARLAAARGEQEAVEQGFKTASAVFREHGLPFDVAVAELEHAEWLLTQGRAEDADPLLAEAREIFERLEAAPWLERVDALAVGVSA